MAAPCLLKDDAAKHVQNEAECPSRVVATGQESRHPPQLGRAAPWSWRAWPEVPSTLAACSVLSAHLPRPLSAVSYVLVNSLLSSLPLRKSAPFTGFHKNLHIVTLGDFEDVGWLSGGRLLLLSPYLFQLPSLSEVRGSVALISGTAILTTPAPPETLLNSFLPYCANSYKQGRLLLSVMNIYKQFAKWSLSLPPAEPTGADERLLPPAEGREVERLNFQPQAKQLSKWRGAGLSDSQPHLLKSPTKNLGRWRRELQSDACLLEEPTWPRSGFVEQVYL